MLIFLSFDINLEHAEVSPNELQESLSESLKGKDYDSNGRCRETNTRVQCLLLSYLFLIWKLRFYFCYGDVVRREDLAIDCQEEVWIFKLDPNLISNSILRYTERLSKVDLAKQSILAIGSYIPGVFRLSDELLTILLADQNLNLFFSWEAVHSLEISVKIDREFPCWKNIRYFTVEILIKLKFRLLVYGLALQDKLKLVLNFKVQLFTQSHTSTSIQRLNLYHKFTDWQRILSPRNRLDCLGIG